MTVDSDKAVDQPAIMHRLVELLRHAPRAYVCVLGIKRNIVDPRPWLDSWGLTNDNVVGLTRLPAELIAPEEAPLVTEISLEARVTGHSSRRVHLRDTTDAEFHVFGLDGIELSSAIVVVPLGEHRLIASERPSGSVAVPQAGVLYVDEIGVIRDLDEPAVMLLSDERNKVVGKPILSFLHPQDVDSGLETWVKAIDRPGVPIRFRFRVALPDGDHLWTDGTLTNCFDDQGEGLVRIQLYDVSHEVEAIEAVAAEKELIAQLTEALPVGVAKFDRQGRVEYANEKLSQLLGVSDVEDFIKLAVHGGVMPEELSAAFNTMLVGAPATVLVQPTNGRSRFLEWILTPVLSVEKVVAGGVLCVNDVTEAVEMRALLEKQATTDLLTGCLNRAGTIRAMDDLLAQQSPGSGVGVLFIDVNNLKSINDTHGHEIGDQIIELVALRISEAVRTVDFVGRFGGDEFVVIAPGLATIEATQKLAERISSLVDGAALVRGREVVVSAAGGVAWAESGKADELLRTADHAMYESKRAKSRTKANTEL